MYEDIGGVVVIGPVESQLRSRQGLVSGPRANV